MSSSSVFFSILCHHSLALSCVADDVRCLWNASAHYYIIIWLRLRQLKTIVINEQQMLQLQRRWNKLRASANAPWNGKIIGKCLSRVYENKRIRWIDGQRCVYVCVWVEYTGGGIQRICVWTGTANIKNCFILWFSTSEVVEGEGGRKAKQTIIIPWHRLETPTDDLVNAKFAFFFGCFRALMENGISAR